MPLKAFWKLIAEVGKVTVEKSGTSEKCALTKTSLKADILDKLRLVKLIAWYDNEMGYASRMADLMLMLKKYID